MRAKRTGEEVLRHPPIVVREVVRRRAVAEDVDEEERLRVAPVGCWLLGVRPEPGGDLREESVVVLHVLKHLGCVVTNARWVEGWEDGGPRWR